MSIAVGRFDCFPSPQICQRPSENQSAMLDRADPSYLTLNRLRMVHKNQIR